MPDDTTFVQINVHAGDRDVFDSVCDYEERGVWDTFRLIVREAAQVRGIVILTEEADDAKTES